MRASYIVAGLVAVGVTAWVMTGNFGRERFPQFFGEPKHAAAPPPLAAAAPQLGPAAAAPMMAVRVQTISASNHTREVTVHGHSEANRTVTVKSELAGSVAEIRVNKGDRVTGGQIIARLDLGDRAARLSEARANAGTKQLDYNIAKALTDQGNQVLTRLVAAQAALESANAALAKIELEIDKTEIRAPFPGVIEDRVAQMGDFLNVGAPVATIVDDDPFLFVGAVPENEVNLLRVNTRASATLIDGRTVQGVVRFVARTADTATRTYRVELSAPNPQHNIRAGMTSTLRIPVGTVQAHLVPASALVLDDHGLVGIKAVNGGGVVEFLPARVMSADAAGAWLDGLPQKVQVITVGHAFVRAGDPVRVVEERPGAGL